MATALKALAGAIGAANVFATEEDQLAYSDHYSPDEARHMPGAGLAMKMLAGAIVAVATWWRFEALGLSPVGVVLALMLLTVPTVLLLAPLLSDKRSEAVTARVWIGAALVIAGSLILIAVE